jgi:hypothetical protein
MAAAVRELPKVLVQVAVRLRPRAEALSFGADRGALARLPVICLSVVRP